LSHTASYDILALNIYISWYESKIWYTFSMKKIFVIPGFKQKTSEPSFLWLQKFLKEKEFDVVMVPITWSRKTMYDYVIEFEEFYLKNKSTENYIFGFSYGAVIAFMAGERLLPKKLFLCSLSSDFKEDLPRMKKWIVRYLGKNRIAEIATRSAVDIAKNLTVPTVVIYGEKEGRNYPELKIRCEETVKFAKNAKLLIAKNAPHGISDPQYSETIKSAFT